MDLSSIILRQGLHEATIYLLPCKVNACKKTNTKYPVSLEGKIKKEEGNRTSPTEQLLFPPQGERNTIPLSLPRAY